MHTVHTARLSFSVPRQQSCSHGVRPPGPRGGNRVAARDQWAPAAVPPRSWRTSRVNSSVISEGTVSGMKLPSA